MNVVSVSAWAEEGPTPEDVAFVQGLLTRFGYNPGPIDGICGNQTTAAVRAFHADRDLPLKPGKIEPQAANVVENLTSHLTKQVMEPATETSALYQEALLGDAEAAENVGMMYRDGEAVAADKMMAYAWWTVAENYGSSLSSALKADLKASGQISPHEINYASALAKEICASADLKNGKNPASTDPAADIRGREATM